MPEEIDFEFLFQKFYFEDKEITKAKLLEGFGQKNFQFEHRYIINNKIKWVAIKGEKIYNENQTPTKVVGVMQDISEEKEIAQRLWESEKHKTLVISTMSEGLVVQDANDKILLANNEAANILGLSYNQLIGKSSYDDLWRASNLNDEPISPEDHPSIFCVKTGKAVNNFLMKVHTGKNEIKIIKINARPIFNQNGIPVESVTTFQDVTDVKKNENALKESEEKYKFLTQKLNQVIWSADANGSITFINEQGKTFFKSSFSKLFGKTGWLSVLHPDDVEKALVTWQHSVKTGATYAITYRVLIDNAYRWVSLNAKPWKNAQGEIQSWVGILIDINEQVKSQLQLEESERKFKTLVQGSRDIFYIMNPIGTITFVSGIITKVLGYLPEEVIGKDHLLFTYKEDIPYIKNAFSCILDTGSNNNTKEYRLLAKDGTHRWVNTSADPIYDQHGNLIQIQGVIRDISAELKHKTELLQNLQKVKFLAEKSEKLISIAELDVLVEFTTTSIRELVGDKGIVSLSTFDKDERTITVQNVNGLNAIMQKIFKIIGFGLDGFKIELDEKLIAQLRKGKLVITQNNVHNLAKGNMKNILAKIIDSVFSQHTLFSYGLLTNEKLIGVVSIYLPNSLVNFDTELLITFLNQIGNTLERINNTELLKESQQKLLETQSIAKILSWEFNLQTQKMKCSNELLQWHEVDNNSEEDVEESIEWFLQFIHHKHKQKMAHIMAKTIESFGEINESVEIITAKGNAKWLKIMGRCIINKKGEVIGLKGSVQDITQEQNIQDELTEAHERNYYLAKASFDVIFDWNVDQNTITWSDSFQSIFGANKVNTLQSWELLIHPKDLPLLKTKIRESFSTPNANKLNFELRMRRHNGEYTYFSCLLLLVRGVNGQVKRGIGSIKDIHEEIITKTERELRLSIYKTLSIDSENIENRLNNLCGLISKSIRLQSCEVWIANLDNKKIIRQGSYIESIEWNAFLTATNNDDIRERSKGLKIAAWNNKKTLFVDLYEESEYDFVRKDVAVKLGAKSTCAKPVEINGSVIAVFVLCSKLPLSELKAAVKVLENLTETIATELQRFKNEAETRSFFNLSKDIFAIAGFDGFFKQINPSLANILGYEQNELLTKPFAEFIYEEDRASTLTYVSHALESESFEQMHTVQNRYLTKNNKIVWLEWSFVIRKNEELIYAVGRDISERIKYTKAIEMQNAKLKDIAWTQSHILRAPLVNIMGLVNLLEMGVDQNMDIQDILGAMKKSTNDFDKVIVDITKKSEALYADFN